MLEERDLPQDTTSQSAGPSIDGQSFGQAIIEEFRRMESSLSEGSVMPIKETEFSLPGSSARRFILQNDTKRFSKGPGQRESAIQGTLSVVSCNKGGTNLVDGPAHQMEWEKPSVKELITSP